MRYHMSRFKRRAYGSFHSCERHQFYLTPMLTRMLRPVVAAIVFLAVAALAVAQDVNVHIEPRKPDSGEAVKPSTGPKDTNPKDTNTPDTAQKAHGKPLQVDVDLVLVNVTVTDDWNRIVTGLEKDNFTIVEGTQAQEVRHFASEDAPISLGVIFDMSGSMSDKIVKAREAVIEFFKTANPQDEFFMISFSDRPQLTTDFTKSVEDVQAKLVFLQAQGRTALLDAIYMGVSKMKDAHNSKKALLIISDGGD